MSPPHSIQIAARVLLVVTIALGESAFAQDPGEASREAEALARRGIEARRAGRDAEALTDFERSYALAPRVSVLAQAGFALQALGRWVEAEQRLEAASGATDPWVARHRATLDASLAAVRAHLGWLVVDVDPAAAEVRIDGARVDAGARTRLPVGRVTVAVSQEGYYPAERSVALRSDEVTREAVTLRPRPPEPVTELLRVPLTAPAVATAGAQSVASRVVARPPRVGSPARWTGGIALVGAGVAVLGLGAGLWLGRDGALGGVTASGCVEGPAEYVCDARTSDAAAARTAHDEATRLGVAAGVSLGVGAALAIAGGAWLVYEALAPRRPVTTRVVVTPGGAGFSF